MLLLQPILRIYWVSLLLCLCSASKQIESSFVVYEVYISREDESVLLFKPWCMLQCGEVFVTYEEEKKKSEADF
uniref:Transmembrane protein n=1 Tax=Arabidopsis thaliana TaxID=3702 RepID=Q0WVM6_ARATH|nr:hypothetical protein [Arabidopsis thaliana]